MTGINLNPLAQITAETLPPKFRPLSPWAYFGLTLLFSVPVVGFVFLIVFSFSQGNINRRNFARSYFCGLIIAAVFVAVMFVIFMVTGLGAELISALNQM